MATGKLEPYTRCLNISVTEQNSVPLDPKTDLGESKKTTHKNRPRVKSKNGFEEKKTKVN